MQSNTMVWAMSSSSSGCCCSSTAEYRSVKPVSSSSRRRSMLGMSQRGILAHAIMLRADKKPSFARSGRKLDKVVPARAQSGGGSGGYLDEKVNELSSEEAVENMQGIDRSARMMVDDLKPVDHPGTTSPRELELRAEAKASEADESLGGKEPVLEVASDSAVDPDHSHENTAATADGLAPELGLTVEYLTGALEDRAEDASNRDAQLLNTDGASGEWEGGVGQIVDVGKGNGVTGEGDRGPEAEAEAESESEAESGELTREVATEKILDAARDGVEVLKWAVEGITSAGANSRENFEAAKQMIDKRLRSFNLAAEETKEVGAQLSEVAKKKYEELQGSASKFNEELQVQLEDKKVADEGKPDSETNPLAQLSQGLQATIQTATKEDGPLAKLGQGIKENVAKVSAAGQDLADSKSPAPSTAEQPQEDSGVLVPVGEKEGFFQDLAPANGSSPEPGDRSTEASDILGEGNVEAQQKDEQEYEGFFGDIPVDRSVSSAKAEEGQTPTASEDAAASMKDDYEHEVGNDQLNDTQQSGQETSSVDASLLHDPSKPLPSVQGLDGMGIGPDE